MKLDVIGPATGALLWALDETAPDDVAAAVTRGREAGRWWSTLGWEGRKARLLGWARNLAAGLEELAGLIHDEMGKPYDDARMEVVGATGIMMWAANNAERVLGDRAVRPQPGMEMVTASVRNRPYGVVGVIGPWNFPVLTPVGVLGSALAAGNAVVFKPSEFTPKVGLWLEKAFAAATPEQPVLQVVTGRGEVGRALVAAQPDKIAFTGSFETGRRVYEQSASLMIPVLLELGGKNAMIVAEDADLDAAARSAVFGAFQNAGQACIGLSRIIVLDAVYDAFVPKLRDSAARLKAAPDGQIGPVVTDRQLSMLRDHVDDALAKGARLLLDGRPVQGSRFAGPTILEGVAPDAHIWREETFAPALIVLRAADLDEAVAIANGTDYGLGGSVFAGEGADDIVDRLRSGMTAVNSAMTFAYLAGLPFGGVGRSGIGRKHGDEGLREFARPHAVAAVAAGQARDSFERPPHAVDAIVAGLRAALGVGGSTSAHGVSS